MSLRAGRISIINNIVSLRTIVTIRRINSQPSINEMTEHLIDSTGHLPPVELVTSLVAQAYDRVKSITEGNVADYIPALALRAVSFSRAAFGNINEISSVTATFFSKIGYQI